MECRSGPNVLFAFRSMMINVLFHFSPRFYALILDVIQVGEMFIVCGVLYAVDSVTERNTKIRLALDLYRNNVVDDVNLAFTNPFKKTTTVGYNHRTKVSGIRSLAAIFFSFIAFWVVQTCWILSFSSAGAVHMGSWQSADVSYTISWPRYWQFQSHRPWEKRWQFECTDANGLWHLSRCECVKWS